MYIPIPNNTPYILVKYEGVPPLHFCAHSFFHAPSYIFVLYLRYTLVNSYYTSSTLTLVMTPHLCYTAGHSRPPALNNCALLVNDATHQ